MNNRVSASTKLSLLLLTEKCCNRHSWLPWVPTIAKLACHNMLLTTLAHLLALLHQ
jgi:hypothetical protein